MNNRGEIKVRFGTVVSILIILGLVIVGAYLLYSNNIKINDLEKELSKQKEFNVAQKEESNKAKANSEKNLENKIDKFVVPSLETAKANKEEKNVEYEVYIEDEFFYLHLEKGIPYIRLKSDADKVAAFAGIEKNEVKMKNEDTKIEGFNKKVVDVCIGCIGQSSAGARIIFLMEDGTVEYSTIKNILKEVSTEGKIDNLKNIVKIQNVNVSDKMGAGYVSIIAIDNENIYYNLND